METPYILNSSPWKTVKDTGYEIALLPWGATEAHNYHLPFGTDSIETEFIASRAAQKAWDKGIKTVILPVIPFGVNTGQLDIYMTINLNPSTQLKILEDVLTSLANHNLNKLIIFNGHGGNDFRPLIRELQPRFPEIFICQLNWFEVLPLKSYFEEGGDHANEMETSVIMHISPELVLPLELAGEGTARRTSIKARNEGWVWFPRAWTKVTDDTGVGNPKKATPEKGKKYIEDITDKIAEFFTELAHTDPDAMYVKIKEK